MTVLFLQLVLFINIKSTLFLNSRFFILKFITCKINIMILLLSTYFGYLFMKTLFQLFGVFCFKNVSYKKHMTGFFFNAFFSCLLVEGLNPSIWLDPVLTFSFMFPIHYSFLWVFLFPMKIRKKILKVLREKKRDYLQGRKSVNFPPSIQDTGRQENSVSSSEGK